MSGVFHIFLLQSSKGQGAGVFFPGPNVGEIEGINDKGMVWASGRQMRRKDSWRDVWLGGGVFGEALSGFVLGWAGVGGVLR